jgi:hypothetical protein
MADGTIVFLHGTGVRFRDYKGSLRKAKEVAAASGVTAQFVECLWGDGLGVDFEGRSLPEPLPDAINGEAANELARWRWLFDDPFFELDQLTMRPQTGPVPPPPPPGQPEEWETTYNTIQAYKPSTDLVLLLKRGGLEEFYQRAQDEVFTSDIPRLAFQNSSTAIPDAAAALSRAIVACLHNRAVSAGQPGPSRRLRESLVERLRDDWGQVVYAPTDFFWNLIKRVSTPIARHYRNRLSDASFLVIGDVLLYQGRGAEIRAYIRDKIEKAAPPVTVVAHSLGGIASFDLLAGPNPPKVNRLVTVGSQAPLLYELGALSSINVPATLPKGFPSWMNIFDRNDFLSYVAKRLFPDATDFEVESGQSFPDSHSAYFGNEEVWKAIRDFVAS